MFLKKSSNVTTIVLLLTSALAVGKPKQAVDTAFFDSLPPPKKISLAVRQGAFEVETQWMTAQQTSSEIDVLSGRVSFKANAKVNADACGDVSFVQTAKILDNSGRNFKWPTSQEARNRIRTQKNAAAGVEDDWFIDHDDTRCQKGNSSCSPFYRDSWPNKDDGSQDGQFRNKAYTRAVLLDYPYGWEVISSAQLETCAVCRMSSEILGCVTWGGSWPTTGTRILQDISSSERPSASFAEALERFKNYY